MTIQTCAALLGYDRRYVMSIYDRHREQLRVALEADIKKHPLQVESQVDETLVHRRKSHRGRLMMAQKSERWVIGGVEHARGGRVYMRAASSRNARACRAFVRHACAPGSIVRTDEWKGYDRLGEDGFDHKTVCHKRNFVCRMTGIHTQRVECVWKVLKRWLASHGYTLTERTEQYIAVQPALRLEGDLAGFVPINDR
jgi:transposase-like protein